MKSSMQKMNFSTCMTAKTLFNLFGVGRFE